MGEGLVTWGSFDFAQDRLWDQGLVVILVIGGDTAGAGVGSRSCTGPMGTSAKSAKGWAASS